MASNDYDEVMQFKNLSEEATTPTQYDNVLLKCANIIPKLTNPKLQIKCLSILKSTTKKYIKLRLK